MKNNTPISHHSPHDHSRHTRPWRLLWATIRHEVWGIASSPAILLVMLGGVVIYGLLYGLLYRPNIVTDAPVVVIDHSNTSLSRRLVELIDATPEVAVINTATELPQARTLLATGTAEAIVYIPHNVERLIGRGEEAIFVVLASTAEFLYYEAIRRGTLGAMQALDGELATSMVVFLPEEDVATIASIKPIEVVGNALFNPSKGYATYLLPAVLMVILFQTMTMVVCLRTGGDRERGRLRYGPTTHSGLLDALVVVIGRSVVYVAIYGLFALFLMGFITHLFDLPHLGSFATLAPIVAPYLVATSLFGITFSTLFADSEAALPAVATFSVGLILLSGISYPLELMPRPWVLLHHLLPAPVGIMAYVKANSMGASVAECYEEISTLWWQCGAYLVLSTLAMWRLGYILKERN